MKKLFLLTLILCTQFAFSQEAEIKRSITTFFEGLQTRDTLKMKTVCYKHLILESITEYKGQGKLDFETAPEYYKQVAAIPIDLIIEERLLDYKINTDGTMAHVWAPYEFYIDNKLVHSGVNSFELFRESGAWKIVYIIDTRRSPKKE